MEEHTRTPSAGCSSPINRERSIALEALTGSGTLSEQSLPRIVDLIERFFVFCDRAFDIEALGEVTAVEASAFVQAPTLERQQRRRCISAVRRYGCCFALPVRSDLRTPTRRSTLGCRRGRHCGLAH